MQTNLLENISVDSDIILIDLIDHIFCIHQILKKNWNKMRQYISSL
jgi:hypothetical protein